MKTETTVGLNRTGMDMSPIDAKEVSSGAMVVPPSSAGDDSAIAALLTECTRSAERIGTMPPPGTMKGALKTAIQAMKGEAPLVLLDKLGERLAFERAGSRLWKAMLAKFDAVGSFEGGPTRGEIEEMQREEAEHFLLLAMVIRELGADPTTETPSADVHGVASCGLLKVVTDPRTNLADGLEAMLIAELTDNDAWDVLIELSKGLSDQELLARFQDARATEARHLKKVRAWVKASVDAVPAVRSPGRGDGRQGARDVLRGGARARRRPAPPGTSGSSAMCTATPISTARCRRAMRRWPRRAPLTPTRLGC